MGDGILFCPWFESIGQSLGQAWAPSASDKSQRRNEGRSPPTCKFPGEGNQPRIHRPVYKGFGIIWGIFMCPLRGNMFLDVLRNPRGPIFVEDRCLRLTPPNYHQQALLIRSWHYGKKPWYPSVTIPKNLADIDGMVIIHRHVSRHWWDATPVIFFCIREARILSLNRFE